MQRLPSHITSQVPFSQGKIILYELTLTVGLKDCISLQSIKIITAILTGLLSLTFMASKKQHKTADKTAEILGLCSCACNFFPNYTSLMREDAPEHLLTSQALKSKPWPPLQPDWVVQHKQSSHILLQKEYMHEGLRIPIDKQKFKPGWFGFFAVNNREDWVLGSALLYSWKQGIYPWTVWKICLGRWSNSGQTSESSLSNSNLV